MDSLSTTAAGAEPVAPPITTTVGPKTTVLRITMATLWTVVILVLCWTPSTWIEQAEKKTPFYGIPNLDKVVHWGIFVVFTVLWLRTSPSRRRYAWVALAGLGLAAITEIVQKLPQIGRDGSLDDTMTDLIGVAIGLVVARWIEPLLRRAESLLVGSSRA